MMTSHADMMVDFEYHKCLLELPFKFELGIEMTVSDRPYHSMMICMDLMNEGEFISFIGSIAAHPVIWHTIIIDPMYLSNDIVLPGIQASA
jgi:hypothetical protein